MDWEEFLNRRRSEARDLDFKAGVPWSGDHRVELLQDIVAMANTSGGGVLVIGIEEEHASGLLVRRGVATADLGTWDQTPVSTYVNDHVQPDVDLDVEKHVVDGTALVFVRVREFRHTPHVFRRQLQRKGTKAVRAEGDIMIRTSAAQTTRLFAPDDVRDFLRRAARKVARADLLDLGSQVAKAPDEELEALSRVHSGARRTWAEGLDDWKGGEGGSLVAMTLFPEGDLSSELGSSPRRREALRLSSTGGVRPTFPPCDFELVDRVDALEGEAGGDCYWHIAASGAFSYAGVVDDDNQRLSEPHAIVLRRLVEAVAGTLLFGSRLYQAAGYRGRIGIELLATGLKDRILANEGAGPPIGGTRCTQSSARLGRVSSSVGIASWREETSAFAERLIAPFGAPASVLRDSLADVAAGVLP